MDVSRRRMLGLGGATEAWPLAEASAAWGRESAEFTFASNSRVRAVAARQRLGWAPRGTALLVGLCGLAVAGGLYIVPAFAAVQAWAPVDRPSCASRSWCEAGGQP